MWTEIPVTNYNFTKRMKEEGLGSKAKVTLAKYVDEVQIHLEEYFQEEIGRKFGFNKRQKDLVKEMLEHVREHNLRISKRLRGSFVHYGYLLGGAEMEERVWRAEMTVELVHTGLLIHDDFMDQDEVRRGGLTSHKFYEKRYKASPHYGEAMAVTAGDAVLCLGFDLLASCGNTEATRKMARGIAETAYGQAYDVTLEQLKGWTEDDVITLHKAKTAIYTYENPLFIGAHLAGLGQKAFDLLHNYSMDGGVAFQLQDDILGVFGTPEKTGKSADSDLLQGKCTLLVLKLLEKGTSIQKKALDKVWGKRKIIGISKKDLELAKEAIVDSGSLDYSRKTAKRLAQRAADTANSLRELKLDSGAIDYIQGIAEYMVNRDV